MGAKVEQAIAVLNGAVGDYLARRGNGLATETSLVFSGRELPPTREALRAAYPEASSRLVVLVHGLMCTETIWAFPDGTDYGSRLASDLGFTPLYVRYNSGLPIPESGARLAALLRVVAENFPVEVEELVLLGFSMGGLVVRAACHAASIDEAHWLRRVRRAIYVGTPHRGAPLERVGRFAARLLETIDEPTTRLLADLANARSAGLKDLGDADLRHEDRARWKAELGLRDPRHPVPLLESVRHYLVAGTLSSDPTLARLFGDSMVPVPSGTFDAIPPAQIAVVSGLAHTTLAHHPDVYAKVRAWMEAP